MKMQSTILRTVTLSAMSAWLVCGTTNLLGADPVLTIEPDPAGLKISWDATDGRDYILEGSDDFTNSITPPYPLLALSLLYTE